MAAGSRDGMLTAGDDSSSPGSHSSSDSSKPSNASWLSCDSVMSLRDSLFAFLMPPPPPLFLHFGQPGKKRCHRLAWGPALEPSPQSCTSHQLKPPSRQPEYYFGDRWTGATDSWGVARAIGYGNVTGEQRAREESAGNCPRLLPKQQRTQNKTQVQFGAAKGLCCWSWRRATQSTHVSLAQHFLQNTNLQPLQLLLEKVPSRPSHL